MTLNGSLANYFTKELISSCKATSNVRLYHSIFSLFGSITVC